MKHTTSSFPVFRRRGMAGLCVIIAITAVWPYLAFDPERFNPATKRFALEPPFRQAALYLHAVCGGLSLLIGPFQFFEGLRHRHPRLHRICGQVYLAGVAVGAVSAFVIAPGMISGVTGEVGLILLGILWLWTAWQGIASAIHGRIGEHQAWMFRNFSLTFAAVTLRLWLLLLLLLLWPLLGSRYGGNFSRMFVDAYGVVMWLSWVPNIVLAEWMLRRQGKRMGTFVRSAQEN